MRKSSIVLLIIAAIGLVFGILMLVFSLRKPKNEGDNQRKNEIHTHQAEKEVRKIRSTFVSIATTRLCSPLILIRRQKV